MFHFVVMEKGEYESTNINSLWLDNIYENLKNLEALERYAREGCASLFDYLQIPEGSREVIIGDTMYKNLKFIVTELNLLLTDLTPVIEKEKLKEFREKLNTVGHAVQNKSIFVKDVRNASRNTILSSNVTDFFYDTLEYLTKMRIDVITEIAPILYVRDERKLEKTKAITELEA